MIYAGIPTILVGLKKDLREDLIAIQEILKKSLRFITENKGETIARDIGAKGYLECSSLSGGGRHWRRLQGCNPYGTPDVWKGGGRRLLHSTTMGFYI